MKGRQDPEPLHTSDVLLGEYEAIFGLDKVGDLRAAIAGVEDENARLQQVHARGARLAPVALCLSGGGIRSASFALGVLQGLAEADLLTRFHYLSTVSGGGYIGSWLSGWLRWAGSCRAVIEGLRAPGDRAEPLPIRHIGTIANFVRRLGMIRRKEPNDAATQRASYPGRHPRPIAGRRRSEDCL